MLDKMPHAAIVNETILPRRHRETGAFSVLSTQAFVAELQPLANSASILIEFLRRISISFTLRFILAFGVYKARRIEINFTAD